MSTRININIGNGYSGFGGNPFMGGRMSGINMLSRMFGGMPGGYDMGLGGFGNFCGSDFGGFGSSLGCFSGLGNFGGFSSGMGCFGGGGFVPSIGCFGGGMGGYAPFGINPFGMGFGQPMFDNRSGFGKTMNTLAGVTEIGLGLSTLSDTYSRRQNQYYQD